MSEPSPIDGLVVLAERLLAAVCAGDLERPSTEGVAALQCATTALWSLATPVAFTQAARARLDLQVLGDAEFDDVLAFMAAEAERRRDAAIAAIDEACADDGPGRINGHRHLHVVPEPVDEAS